MHKNTSNPNLSSCQSKKTHLTTYFVLVMTDSSVLNSGVLPFWVQTMERWTATSSPLTSRNCNRIWALTSVSLATFGKGKKKKKTNRMREILLKVQRNMCLSSCGVCSNHPQLCFSSLQLKVGYDLSIPVLFTTREQWSILLRSKHTWHLAIMIYLWIMNKCFSFGARRKITSGYIFKTFNDSLRKWK